MLGVTILTSLNQAEVQSPYKAFVSEVVMNLAEMAVEAGILGVVASPLAVRQIKSNLETKPFFAMIPSTESKTVDCVD